MTDDELSDEDVRSKGPDLSHSERLFAAFQQRHIRLRLRSTKLPPNYTISLRLPSANDRAAQPKKPKRKRRRVESITMSSKAEIQTDSDSDTAVPFASGESAALVNDEYAESNDVDAGNASEDEEDTAIRANNAYTGATNTIGSVHQRHWFLTLDRRNSGFRKMSSGRWEGSWDPFFVKGRDVERSVVTGRTADEVMEDDGVSKFVGRKMWRPIME